jgi:hypothetical protein
VQDFNGKIRGFSRPFLSHSRIRKSV